ncbi:MAG: hypothetical protein ACKN9V_10085 [Pseudomonadota bacterium]
MKNYLLHLLGFITFIGFSAYSLEGEAPQIEPQLSAAGMRRLEENRQILLKNIQTAKTNVENCQANLSTVEKQIEEVSKIEAELGKLKDQYDAFLEKAASETKKNLEALNQLSKSKDRRLAATEKTEREAWTKDTSDKVSKVKELLQKLRKDVEGVRFRKKDLTTQKNHWLERERYHQRMVDELMAKQTDTEKKLKGDG